MSPSDAKRLFKTPEQWREWLEQHHDTSDGLWLILYKVAPKNAGSKKASAKNAGTKAASAKKRSLAYGEAVEEALCFGWIDSQLRRIDDEKHVLRFTPRRRGGNWSASNRARVDKLIEEGRMTPAGLAVIEAAKEDGSWQRLEAIERGDVPDDLERALSRDKKAADAYARLAPSHRQQFLYWIATAKREETRARRIAQTIERLKTGKLP